MLAEGVETLIFAVLFYVVSGNMCGCGQGCQSASVRVKTHLVSCI